MTIHVKMIVCVICFLLPAIRASAQGTDWEFVDRDLLPMDYEALFAANQDDVTAISESSERLELPGPVIVTRIKDRDVWEYVGLDQSEHGAVGCMLRILYSIDSIATHCSNILDDAQRTTLGTSLSKLQKFYAENTFPPVSSEALQAALVKRRAAVLSAHPEEPRICKESDLGGPDTASFITLLLDSLADESLLDRTLATPRLPVTNPCL
jgi:hypothetical protein